MLREAPAPYEYGIHNLKIEYPTYSVVTPQTGLCFTVRPLTVSELHKVRGSITNAAGAIKVINDIVWSAIDQKPEFIKTKKDLLRFLTIKDREALLHGIFVMTFGEIKEFRLRCRSCGFEKDVNINLSECFSIQPYPGSQAMINQYKLAKALDPNQVDPEMEKIIKEKSEKVDPKSIRQQVISELDPEMAGSMENTPPPDIPPLVPDDLPPKKPENVVSVEFELPEPLKDSILTKEERVELPISKVTAVIYQPTMEDEEKLSEIIPFAQKQDMLDLATETIIIKRFEYTVDKPYGKENLAITDRMQIYTEYQKLPLPDSDLILETYMKNFGNYGISLQTTWTCMNCASSNDVTIDIMDQFFRATIIRPRPRST